MFKFLVSLSILYTVASATITTSVNPGDTDTFYIICNPTLDRQNVSNPLYTVKILKGNSEATFIYANTNYRSNNPDLKVLINETYSEYKTTSFKFTDLKGKEEDNNKTYVWQVVAFTFQLIYSYSEEDKTSLVTSNIDLKAYMCSFIVDNDAPEVFESLIKKIKDNPIDNDKTFKYFLLFLVIIIIGIGAGLLFWIYKSRKIFDFEDLNYENVEI